MKLVEIFNEAAAGSRPGDWTPGGGSKEVTIGATTITYGIGSDGQTGEIILVQTPRGARGQGSARAALEQFLVDADRHGVTLFLNSDPMDKGVRKPKLDAFYRSLGFVKNMGRKKDFRSRAEFVRPPIQRPTVESSRPLTEEIHGSVCTGYHRTRDEVTINRIKRGGKMLPGGGDMYGSGIYLTYELRSQFADYMDVYGDFIIKCQVDLRGFLILDRPVALSVYGQRATIRDQIQSNGWTCKVNDKILDIWEAGLSKPGFFTANLAQNIHERGQINGMRGLVYTGQRDGHVVVAYHPEDVRPIAWCDAPVSKGMSASLSWTPLD